MRSSYVQRNEQLKRWLENAGAKEISTPYLFDLLTLPAYKMSWNELFRKEKNVDEWLEQYEVTFDEPASPIKELTSGGVSYQLTSVCKRHDCGDNIFFVMFAENGRKAWGMLLTDRTNARFFGAPNETIKQLLRRADEQLN